MTLGSVCCAGDAARIRSGRDADMALELVSEMRLVYEATFGSGVSNTAPLRQEPFGLQQPQLYLVGMRR